MQEAITYPRIDAATRQARLERPSGRIKAVLDTDTFNEVDDQYALSYAVLSPERIDLQAVYAAPFSNLKAATPDIGMEKSYAEILHVLELLGREDLKARVYRGSRAYLKDLRYPVPSDAAKDLIARIRALPEGEVLYVVPIGALTNVASAILMAPEIIEKMVVVWLGGNAPGWPDNLEFNCMQDTLSVSVVFDCGVPLVQLPAWGVTSHLLTTEPELRHYLKGKSPLGDYLYEITCGQAVFEGMGKVWSKEIWDIVTIAYLVGEEDWIDTALIHSPIITAEHTYGYDPRRHLIRQALYVRRDKVFEDLFTKLTRV